MIHLDTYRVVTNIGETPNSDLPVLVYRRALNERMIDQDAPESIRRERIDKMLTPNKWEAEKIYPSIVNPHFHPNVHELYAIIRGSSKLCLGVDVMEPESKTNKEAAHVEIEVEEGDVIVIPAGVSHCSKTFSPDYRYLAAYPSNGEKWILVNKHYLMKNLKFPDNKLVPLPLEDPVYGLNGPLIRLWQPIHMKELAA